MKNQITLSVLASMALIFSSSMAHAADSPYDICVYRQAFDKAGNSVGSASATCTSVIDVKSGKEMENLILNFHKTRLESVIIQVLSMKAFNHLKLTSCYIVPPSSSEGTSTQECIFTK